VKTKATRPSVRALLAVRPMTVPDIIERVGNRDRATDAIKLLVAQGAAELFTVEQGNGWTFPAVRAVATGGAQC
jgi:hypothetical protein